MPNVKHYGYNDLYTGWGQSGADNNGNVLRSHHYVPDNDQISGWSLNYQDYTYDTLNRLRAVAETSGRNTGGWFNAYRQANGYDRYGNRTLNVETTCGGSQTLATRQFVVSLYQSVLGREADAGGLEMWHDILSEGYAQGQAELLARDKTTVAGFFRSMVTVAAPAYYEVVARHSGKCLDVSGAGTHNGARLHQWDCAGVANQQWQLVPTGDGYMQVVARHSGKGLDVSNASYDNGAGIAQCPYVGGVNQQWQLRAVGAAGGAAELNWLITDHLGTPRMVADQMGSLVGIKRHDYLPFGEEIGAGVGGRTTGQGYVADNVRQQFTGYERDDETGLDYAQARYYSYTQGRFTSPDDFINDTHVSDPQSWNLYVYVRNNPLGRCCINGHGCGGFANLYA